MNEEKKKPLFIVEYYGNTDIYSFERLMQSLKEIYEGTVDNKPVVFAIKMIPPGHIELSATRERGGDE